MFARNFVSAIAMYTMIMINKPLNLLKWLEFISVIISN